VFGQLALSKHPIRDLPGKAGGALYCERWVWIEEVGEAAVGAAPLLHDPWGKKI
jgi:hypothetical protein